MMSSSEIRQQFLDFFKAKGHTIVPSSPIVIKDDPTLLFTNAGMNQFKDYFLGNKIPLCKRVADTQKCLRVSGKHNDLEEVGVDTYHHTMFEMLGNWSFGDYFKKEAIAWSWELLTEVYKIPKENLYVTVFEGDAKENLPGDEDSIALWKEWIDEDRIIMGNKKDNFWEMGDTGPCGPCTEIHFDNRPPEERKKVAGKTLVNKDDPQVIEIWNNVFIEYNRKKDGSLEPLPAKHVDTGMGFERLVRVIQGKQSNYDTDVFSETIAEVEKLSNRKYTNTDSKQDIAFRVIADHIRAIAFPIADGQLPSNTGAGYVIRRILRRAVRYYFSYLDVKEPLLYKLIPLIAKEFENVFPELDNQMDFIRKVVKDEEEAFLRTLGNGIQHLNIHLEYLKNIRTYLESNKEENIELLIDHIANNILQPSNGFFAVDLRRRIGNIHNHEEAFQILYDHVSLVSGKELFRLHDTFGFPIDLTKIIVQEKGFNVDEAGFEREMIQQKNRSRAASIIDSEEWEWREHTSVLTEFVGYVVNECRSMIARYRTVKINDNEAYQFVLWQTPFYSESGGQVGDTGIFKFEGGDEIKVLDTKKENELIIHYLEKFPKSASNYVLAKIDLNRRKKIQVHHTATHLMHAALRRVLGNHVAQKGSLVNDEHLRFDFSHFVKVTDEELAKIESLVNEKIRENIPVVIKQMKKDEAIAIGAMALFGEKYGETVRVVIIDPAYSIELCGGTHVGNTGELGFFKIKHETAIGAGVRRIEAVSGKAVEEYIGKEFDTLRVIRETLKNPKDIIKGIENLITENGELKKQAEKFELSYLSSLKNDLLKKAEKINDVNFIGQIIDVTAADSLRKICFSLKNELKDFCIVLAAVINGKAHVALMIDEGIITAKKLDATKVIKEYVAPLINGGGGGQKSFATAGGHLTSGLSNVIEQVKLLL